MEARQYRKLWWDIILATVCFSVVPLFILGGVIYHQFSVSYTAKIMENMKTLAENRASSIDLFLEERIAQLTGLANTQSLGQLQNEDYLSKVFNIIQTRSKSFLDLGIIDEDGNHLAYVGPYYSILKKVNYKDEKWFHEVMATGVHVSDVFLGFRKIPISSLPSWCGRRTGVGFSGPPSIRTSSTISCGPPGSAKKATP